MSANADLIARWFGLRPYDFAPPHATQQPPPRPPAPGEILLITGPSGSGKSLLLRQTLAQPHPHCVIDVNAIELPEAPTIDVVTTAPIDRALRLLSLVGLAEAHTYLLPPSALSDGQRFRLRLAVALGRSPAHRPALIVADEFAALLDRLTASVLARSLRRLTRHPDFPHPAFLLATSHADLTPSLQPDRTILCDFGQWQEQETKTGSYPIAKSCPTRIRGKKPQKLTPNALNNTNHNHSSPSASTLPFTK